MTSAGFVSDNRRELRLSSRLSTAILTAAFDGEISQLSFHLAVSVVMPIVGIISLARRNIIPATLNESHRELFASISRDLFRSQVKEHVDSTEFATASTAVIEPDSLVIWTPTKIEQLITVLRSIVGSEDAALELSSPLLAGWTYQHLQINRNDYAALRASKELNSLDDLTQWFSPSWISEFLVDEVLGPSDASGAGGAAPTFIDSACGAGHILVPAFHRLIRSACTDFGSSARANIVERDVENDDDKQAIIRAIEAVLSAQLFGLDVDPKMVQLSAFALYLACRDIEREAPFPIPHIYYFVDDSSPRCGGKNASVEEPHLVNKSGTGKQSLHEPAADVRTITKRIAEGVSDAAYRAGFGSLLLGVEPRTRKIALRKVDGKKIAFNELPKSFSAQATNPPYLSHRSMPKELCTFLRKQYPGCHYDIYAAFLELSVRLMEKNSGRISMICQQSFLNIQRYESLRRSLMSRCSIRTIVQLGPGSFAARGGEKVSNAIVSLSSINERFAESNVVSVYDLLDRKSKVEAESYGLACAHRTQITESLLKNVSMLVPGHPISTSWPEEIAKTFSLFPPLESDGTEIFLANGLFTCNNEKFVRHFSEVSNEDKNSYVPYDKGGGQKWYATTANLIRWDDNGEAIRRYREERGQARALPGERFYFQPGVTYSYIGTKGFKARMLTPGAVFDIASSAVFSRQLDLHYILGFLNSSLVRFILGKLNPTVNFQIGDLRRLPFAAPSRAVEERVARLSLDAVELAKTLDRLNPKSPSYAGPALLQLSGLKAPITDDAALRTAYQELSFALGELNQREQEIQSYIDQEIFKLYEISADTAYGIIKDRWVLHGASALSTVPTFEKTVAEILNFNHLQVAARTGHS